MGKRNKLRKRQNDPSEGDTGTSDEERAKKCQHLAKGINVPELKKRIVQGVKIHECDGCIKEQKKISTTSEETEVGLLQEVESKAKDIESKVEVNVAEASDFSSDDKSLKTKEEENGCWICLQCGHKGCGRAENEHALKHYKTPHSVSHDLAVDTITWMTWCYKCDDYVTVESSRLNQVIEYMRKQSGLADKPKPVTNHHIRRSQSQLINKDSMKSGISSSLLDLKGKDGKLKEVNEVVQILPPVKGLVNLGNTCFFNSVMQVLSQTHWLTQLLDLECRDGQVIHLKGSENGTSCNSSCSTLSEIDNCDSGIGSVDCDSTELDPVAEPIDVILGTGKPLTLTLASFLKDMHCPAVGFGTGKRKQMTTVTPSSLFNQISKKSPQFRGFQQQDAHELLRHLLDGVRTEEITRRRHAIMSHFYLPVRPNSTDIDPKMKKKFKIYGKESAHTFVDKLFGGQLLSTLICESCHNTYQILEGFMDLSLPVSEDKTPPATTKRKTVDCLSPPLSPAVNSNRHSKKERKSLQRKAKANLSVRRTSSKENENLAPEEDSVSTENGACFKDSVEDSSDGSSDEDAVQETTQPDEEAGELSESADVEDNDMHEENDKEVDNLDSKMKRMNISSQGNSSQEVNQNKLDNADAKKKTRCEWISRSLCSLAVRYQATPQECSVESCLNLFTAPELLTGSNKYGCENCTRRKAAAEAAEGVENGGKTATVYNVASKQLLVFVPPALLTLHLKRFTQNGVTLRKVQRHVDFKTVFDLAPFCSAGAAGVGSISAEQKQVLYSLYGVIEHSGRLSNGHYTAFVKVRPVLSESLTKFLQELPMQTGDLNRLHERIVMERGVTEAGNIPPSEGVWYHASDTHVMPVSEEKVLRAQAFLLFYERIL